VLQEYVVAPEAVRLVELPEQIVALFTLTVGLVPIVTEVTNEFVQPAELVPVTV
jgi:hypothetical protein